MRRIAQRGEDDCGIACIAMIVGCSYAEAIDLVFPDKKPKRPLTRPIHLRKALERRGIVSKWHKRLKEDKRYQTLVEDAILGVDLPDHRGTREWHWVVWDGVKRRILDPDSPGVKRPRQVRGLLIVDRTATV